MIKKIFSFVIATATIIIAFSACNDRPVSIGIEFLPDTVALESINSENYNLINSAYSYHINLPMFNSGGVLIGQKDDFKAAFIMRFAGFPRDLTYLESDDILSAKIILFPSRYAFGDSVGGNLSFRVVQVNKEWKRDTPEWDELFVPPYQFFDYNKIVATWSGSIALQDSMPPIEIDINDKQTIIDNWFRLFSNPPDTVEWGMAFIPEDGLNVINSFYANGINLEEEVLPYAQVIYRNQEGGIDTLKIDAAITAGYATAPEVPENKIILQGAVNYRSRFKFDIKDIPPFAGIQKSQFELYIDTSSCIYGNKGIDTLMLLNFYLEPEESLFPFLEFVGRRQGNSDKFVFTSVSSALEVWNREEGVGELVLENYSGLAENIQIDRLVFWGPDAPDPSKRPKLTIYYSILR